MRCFCYAIAIYSLRMISVGKAIQFEQMYLDKSRLQVDNLIIRYWSVDFFLSGSKMQTG